VYGQVRQATQAGGQVKRCCQWVEVHRAGYYRALAPVVPDQQELELRNLIQEIAVQWPAYGYRRVARELWDKYGCRVNRKRVLRIMQADNLLCLRRKAFWLPTTNSAHRWPVFANVAAEMKGRLTGTNQLWVADITYIRLETEFVYLAVVLDAYSRRVVGWALGRTLEAELALTALRMAVAQRRPDPGLVHHSDRGVQYACAEYRELLGQHQIRGSMSRAGNPYDNAFAESFIKTLKYEEVYRNHYRDMAEAQAAIAEFIDEVYNQKRLHSALGYRSPVEFERMRA
jgi:putative transposase